MGFSVEATRFFVRRADDKPPHTSNIAFAGFYWGLLGVVGSYTQRRCLHVQVPEGKQPDSFELIFPYIYKSFARANGSLTLVQLLDASVLETRSPMADM
jgi:hypothetical protein